MDKPRIDLTGKTFGRLLVLRYEGARRGCGWWYCRCDCGVYKAFRTNQLTGGFARGCGCGRALSLKRRMSHREQQRLKALYTSGLSLRACADALGYTNGTYLALVLRRMGVALRPRGGTSPVSMEAILAAYAETHSLTETGRRVGLKPSAVHGRLARYQQRQQKEARPC